MRDSDYATLRLESPAPRVLQITLNRPEAANAFNTQMAGDLLHCFESLALDFGDNRCLVVTGAGERAFCAGADLKERDGMTDEAWYARNTFPGMQNNAEVVANALAIIDGMLAADAFLAGPEPTLADISAYEELGQNQAKYADCTDYTVSTTFDEP